ncbi:MAG: hypothetical protein IMZ55_19110 [Acidobacteria bacterium]|nr:hypothetical protein [Planctomycetota bacterium]MBE3135582.1 hypothetical protein [Acidobacteriota bacterium]
MTRWTLTVWLLVGLPGLAAAASPPAALPGAQPAQMEDYRVLSERNMFLRNRARPPASHAAPAPPRAAPADTGDDRIVLTGIIQQGEDYLAFFEDTRTGKTTTLQAGDPLGRGQLAAIEIDAVYYTCDGNSTKVAIGSNLTGAAASLPKPAAPTSTAATAPRAAPAAPTPATVSQATGAAPGATPAAPGPATASTTPPAAASPQTAPSDDTKDSGTAAILEQMRQRRERDMNK